MNHKVLLIEDDEIMRVTLKDPLTENGYDVQTSERGIDGITAFNEDEFSLVVTDVRLPDMQGIEVLRRVKEKSESVPVIVMTAFGTIKDAVETMKLGAYDYITKPFSLEEFSMVVNRALEVKNLREENIRLRRDLSDCYGHPNIVGESEQMQKIYELIEQVSKTDSTVLVLGENGTGKELIASAIHYQSRRRNGPLIRVNCSAFPENLVESELFGYEKGAFSGAANRKPGRFERADKGTIFLDEIGELPHSVQVKLLRVLQDGSFERLGGTKALNVDVRVITATNRNLEDDVKNGRFREDLYYRLHVIPVHMPSLRDRRDDIPLLVEHFMGIYNCKFARRTAITSQAVGELMHYEFPGNVRELGNILERCVTLSSGDTINVEDLPQHIVKNQKDPYADTLSEVTAEAEKAQIKRILLTTKGNKTKAAEVLGISRKCLWEKVKIYNIEQ
jgi:two-component system response regulator AtoC